MWRTSSRWLAVSLLSFTLGCSGQSSAPRFATADKTADETLSDNALASSPTEAEPTFETQFEKVLAGEAIGIRLAQAKISAEQLVKLREVASKLLELQLDAGVIDDTSLGSIASLTALEHLRLRGSPITDAGITKLDPAKLPNLRILNLPQASLSAAGLEHLATFPNLVQLRMGGAKCDDGAAEVLARFPALRSLHLIGPKFTDGALERLAKAPKLASLYIDDCHMSDSAWERLFAAKPSLHVHIDQHHHDRDPKADH